MRAETQTTWTTRPFVVTGMWDAGMWVVSGWWGRGKGGGGGAKAVKGLMHDSLRMHDIVDVHLLVVLALACFAKHMNIQTAAGDVICRGDAPRTPVEPLGKNADNSKTTPRLVKAFLVSTPSLSRAVARAKAKTIS